MSTIGLFPSKHYNAGLLTYSKYLMSTVNALNASDQWKCLEGTDWSILMYTNSRLVYWNILKSFSVQGLR